MRHISGVLILILLAGIFLFCGCSRTVSEANLPGEGRAVWIHAGMFPNPQETAMDSLRKLLDGYAETGINTLFCFNTLPGQHGKGWDFLPVLVELSHSRGIKVHPIVAPGYTVNTKTNPALKPEWLIRTLDNDTLPNLNLALEEARNIVLEEIKTLLTYPIDGIQLDYIRFPLEQKYGYDPKTAGAFRAVSGFSPLEVSHDCGSMVWCEWIFWNAERITDLVRDIRRTMDRSTRRIPLSAAVFPDSRTSSVLIGQDWPQWGKNRFVDILCPMLYTDNDSLFGAYIRRAVREAYPSPVWAGIGIVSSHNRNTPERTASQVDLARKAGARGVAFFSGYSLTGPFQETLAARSFGRLRKETP